jgi:hypothetical protein
VARVGVTAGLIVFAWAARASAQIAPPAPDSVAIGDWQLAPLLEVRARGEYRHDLDGQDRGSLVERARLGVDVQRGPVEGHVVLQDVRDWDLAAGNERPWESGALASTGAYEAWLEAHSASPSPMFVRLGRQPVTWGEGRLLGIADWAPRARSLDAVRGGLPVADGELELLAATLSDPTGATLASFGELFGARGQWAFHPLFAIEGYVLARLAQDNPPSGTDVTVRGQTYTGALRLHGDAFAWTWGIEGAYQGGYADDLNGGSSRSAWAAAGHVAHMFERIVLTPTFRVGASYASGEDGARTYHQFDPMFPDVHVWQGAMDLFAWSNEYEGNARVAAVPWTDAVARLEYRYARLVQAGGAWIAANLAPVGQAPANASPDLGHEIDAVLTWLPWPQVELTAGYSMLILGDGARAILTAPGLAPPDVSHFAYAQTTLKVP